MTVSRGTATVTTSGAQTDINVSGNAFLNWQSFNINPGESTVFHQPSAASVVWNRITDPNPSQIWGNLSANGIVVLMNQSGFFFGPGSVVNAAGFVATTATTLPDFGGGGAWTFNGPPPLASIINYGEIKASSGGSVFLVAEKIENHGVLTAPDGTLGLYAGKQVLMSERPDGRGLSVAVNLPEGSVDNLGRIVADAGSIFLHGQIVNQKGIIQANSVRERNGVIELFASDSVNLGASSAIEARGDSIGSSSGGKVSVKSDGSFSDSAGARISVAGGASGGAGGQVELSAPSMLEIHSVVDGHAASGYSGGSLLIDPNDIWIGTSRGGPAGSLFLNVNSSFLGMDNITYTATRTISVQAGTTWDLGQSTGLSGGSHLLRLDAGTDLTIQAGASLNASPGWSVSLNAGRDFTSPDAFKLNTGALTFQPGAVMQASDGSVTVRAGKSVTLQAGTIWNLGQSSSLLLQSAGDMTFQAGTSITAGQNWSGTIAAGVDFTTPGAFRSAGALLFQPGCTFSVQSGTVDMRAGRSITVQSGTTWDLGQTSSLNLLSGGDLTFQASSAITAGQNWSATMEAGVDFTTPGAFKPNTGNILFQPAFSLTAQSGSLTILGGRNITMQSANLWNLGSASGGSSVPSQLDIEAANNLLIQAAATIKAGQGWSASLAAGRDFSTAADLIPGTGSIQFTGNGALETLDGSISLRAGKDVTVASGFVHTMGGGGISVLALAGNVNTGSKANGFQFFGQNNVTDGTYMSVDPSLGGISTGAGGNLNITAGLDVTSLLPTGTQVLAEDGGTGAFGSQPGNVTINAGGNVAGHYVLRNGSGSITAGIDAGTQVRQLALSLVKGGWDVEAGQDVLLQEVRNPNGIFNAFNYHGLNNTVTKHFFDYAPDAYVHLTGGNSVQLLGANLPRKSGTFEQSIPAIYAPSLEITSHGADGVSIANNIRLFPSPTGELRITTTDGGALTGTKAGDLVNLIISDSGKSQYTSSADFAADDHAAHPLHFADPDPVKLDISGDMTSVLLVAPKHTEITVGGNMVNSRFNVQNLHAGDVTSLNVAGDIENRNEFTSVPLSTAPDFSVFDRAYPPLPSSVASLPGKFRYNATTHTLTFQGPMDSEELAALTSLQVQKLDPHSGVPLVDAKGNPIVETIAVIDPKAAQALFDASQDVPQNPNTGYLVNGPGKVNVSAQNMDLGATLGIQSLGPSVLHGLAALSPSGAAVNVHLGGNLDMFSTTISSVAGGNVTVDAGGYINVGSADFAGDQLARGIFTVAKSDVTVVAGGDINVNGSRIAAYDGGNITVISSHGSVDAGHGGQGAVEVTKIYVDPKTGEVLSYTPTIPGSGILATTFPPALDPKFPNSKNFVGNILVETPEGNISASAGGIVQLALNGVDARNATVALTAGSRDAQGNVLFKGSIDASGSGVIGSNVKLDATDGIKGLVVAQHNISINAQQNVNVTAIGSGNVSVTAGGTVSGTIVGVGSVTASGSSIDAALLSQNVSASGNLSGAQVGFGQANAAGATSQSALNNDDQGKKVAFNDQGGGDDTDEKKKLARTARPGLVRRVGRVTVILPKNE
jgi:filamentous hemagglutinin family protein